MALSYNEYTADGTQTTFVSKPYLEASHLEVSLNGILQASSVYTVTGTAVTFNTPPPSGSRVRIGRNSNQESRLTDYEDASLLTADAMDADAKQLFFMAQEAIDTASETNLASSTFYNASVNAPEGPSIGDLWYDTSNKFLKIYNGETWELASPSNETFTFTNTNFITDNYYKYVSVIGLNDDVFVFLNGVKLVRAASLNALATEDYFVDLVQGRIYFQSLASTDVVQVVLAASDVGSFNRTNVEDFTATAGQTVFDLTKAYVPATDTLHVYVNGVRKSSSSYVESSSTQVTLNQGVSAGDEVTFISNQFLSSQAQTTTANVTGQLPASRIDFTQLGTGAVLRTAQVKMQESVHIDDFGAVGDGSTDDYTALSNFFTSANANPGVVHTLGAKTYATTQTLPQINAANVKIIGQGVEVHDVGTVITGTVIKWTGASATAGPLIKFAPTSGSSNQRLSGIDFIGIGVDCNNGNINYGIEIQSVQESNFDIASINAGNTALTIGVVSTLGEAKDPQRNNIKFIGRQIEASGGFALTCGGDSTANVSMNNFWCDIQHSNLQAIYLTNADNNDWHFVRTYRTSSGTAGECIALLGGSSDTERVRSERFHFLSCNTPVHVYGTSGSPSYAYASTHSKIYCLDTENGSPVPAVEGGASIHYQKDTTALLDDPWVSYTPVVSAGSGSLTSYSASGSYIRRGNVVFVKLQIVISDNGNGSAYLNVSMPMSSAGSVGQTIDGKERSATGRQISGYLDSGTNNATLQFYDASYPGGNGHVINLSGFYEVS